jgi:hypothetical protein
VALEHSLKLLRAQLASTNPTPETMRLLKAVWRQLGDAERRDLLSNLGSPPSQHEVLSRKEDDDLHSRLLRQWRWLTGVADTLPGEWQSSYEAMRSEFGQGDPEARRYRTSFRYGMKSPFTADEINDMGPERFAEWARDWTPRSGWDEPTPAGLSEELTKAVRGSISTWMLVVPELAEGLHHPVYIRGVLEGFRDALKEGDTTLDWERVLSLIELVASEPWSVVQLSSDRFEFDPDWTECWRVCLWTIEEAANRDTAFEQPLFDRLWNVTMELMRKRDPESSVLDGDLLTKAINKVSTRALETLFSLALSLSRQGGELAPWREKLGEAVREELLAGPGEAQLAATIVARLFPQFVHILGESWESFVTDLFGIPGPNDLNLSAVETLIEWARPISNQMLVTFRPYVEAYLDADRANEAERTERDAIRWLAIGYIRRLPEQDDAGVLLRLIGRPERISKTAEFYGRVLREPAELEPAEIETALTFWDEALQSRDLPPEAFLGFGWWSEAASIDEAGWLSRTYATLVRTEGRIDWEDQVVQRLIRLRDHPDAWRALSVLIREAADRWMVSYWARNLHELFSQTESAIGEVQEQRRELLERLVERELHDFRQYFTSRS